MPTPLLASSLRRLRSFGRAPRIMGIDVARGLAVIGMIGAHIGVTEAFEWARIETWTDLVHGRSSILFAIVAGISVAILSRGARELPLEDLRTLRLRFLGRGVAVFAIGLFLEFLNTGVAVILTFYGIVFVIAIPLLQLSRRQLALAAIFMALLGPLLLGTLRVLSQYASGPGLDLVVTGTYPITVWICFLFFGMWIGRGNLESRSFAAKLLVFGVVVSATGYGLGALAHAQERYSEGVDSSVSWSNSSPGSSGSGGSVTTIVPGDEVELDGLVCERYEDDWVTCYPEGDYVPIEEEPGAEGEYPGYWETVMNSDPGSQIWDGVIADTPHSGGTLEILGSGGFGTAIIALCLLIARPLRYVLFPIAALGSMPLSAYSVHVVAILFLAGSAGSAETNTIWIALTAALLVGSTLWVVLLGRGPLESLTAWTSRRFANGPRSIRAHSVETLPTSEAFAEPAESTHPDRI